jgi:hypothetical protein
MILYQLNVLKCLDSHGNVLGLEGTLYCCEK